MEDSSITEKTESLLEKFRRVKRELQLLREYKRNVPWYEKEHYQTFKITPVKAVLMYRGKHLEGIFKIQVLSLDVPAREVNCLLFTETGTKELIIRTFSDSLMLKVLELYNKGKDVLHVKIDSGVINQVFDEEELARKERSYRKRQVK